MSKLKTYFSDINIYKVYCSFSGLLGLPVSRKMRSNGYEQNSANVRKGFLGFLQSLLENYGIVP